MWRILAFLLGFFGTFGGLALQLIALHDAGLMWLGVANLVVGSVVGALLMMPALDWAAGRRWSPRDWLDRK